MKQIKLHLGSADKKIPGYRSLDCRYLPGVDEVSNIKLLRRYDKNSVDVIYACAVLEHFGRWEYKHVLQRWYEVLKSNGTLRVSVPDWDAVVEHYIEHKNLEILRGFLHGGQDYVENVHYVIHNWDTLSRDLYDVGFQKVQIYNWRETEHSHIDDFSQSYLPHKQKDKGKLMHLNIEAIK